MVLGGLMKLFIIMIVLSIFVFIGGMIFIQNQFTPPQNDKVVFIPTIETETSPEPFTRLQEPIEESEELEEEEPEESEPRVLSTIHIANLMPLHDSLYGRRVGHITPRLVEGHIHENTRWAMIIIDDEDYWVDLDFEIPVWELENFFASFSNENVAIYYENLATGFSMSLDGDRVWFGASAIKAPFAIYIYTKASKGETDLDETIELTRADFVGGSGELQRNTPYGKKFSQHELLKLLLVNSDNIALKMLIRHHGVDGFKEFAESIGANPDHIHSIRYSHLTANNSGLFMREIYNLYASGDPYGEMLINNMKRNIDKFISGGTAGHDTATKSGWSDAVSASGDAYHDMAIVFAPSPYILVIMSPWSKNDLWWNHRIWTFGDISNFIQQFNDRWF